MKIFVTFLFCLICTTSAAQNNTFKFVLSTGPGSGSDIMIEAFQPCFKKNNISVIKEFKPGADGLIALKNVISIENSRDFTPVLVGNFGLNMLSKFPNINLLEDIHPITYLSINPVAFSGKTGVIDTFEQLITLSKTRPITVGTSFLSGNWYANQLFGQLQIPYQNIPYKNNTNALIDVANGQLDVSIDTLTASKVFGESGKTKIILIAGDYKQTETNNLPNIEKYSAYLATIPSGVVLSVAPDTNKLTKELLQDVVNNCNKDIETKQKIEKLGASSIVIRENQVRQIVRSVISK